MNSYTNIAVVSKEQEDFLAFEREFQQSVDELAKALAISRGAGAKATNLSNKGTLKMVWGSFNGDNDKELAQMTSSLATSLTVTQTVLQMVMKISHRKNGFLKQFHEVLVNKIANLTKDTKTLDRNQRDATVVILEEIESHVAGQLAQHDMVDEHQRRLESIDRYIEAADLEACDFKEKLALFSSHLGDLRKRENSFAIRLDAQEARGDKLDAFAKTFHQEQERISAKTAKSIDELQSLTARHGEQLDAFSGAAAQERVLHDEHRAITDQQQRQIEELGRTMDAIRVQMASQREGIEHLEGVISRSNSVTRMVLRYAPVLVALGLSGAALLRTGSMLAN